MGQLKNAFLMLLLSQGTPLIFQGDEFGNSQGGNNNAWCQDNETGWVNWKKLRQNKELFEFVKEAVSIRKMHSILHLESELKGADYKAVGQFNIDGNGYLTDANGNFVYGFRPDDEREPLNVYGQTKYEGELAIEEHVKKFFTVRIAWVFGVNGKNFIKTMLNVGKTHDKLTVVNDQIGTPTYTYDLSRLLVDMIETDKYGYYHATNEGGYISWYDFTKEIFKQAAELGHKEYSDDRITVSPVTTEEYGVSKAARPFNSRLDKSKLVENGFTPLPTWQDALHRYLQEIERKDN